jgi:hypothetical protein
MMAGTDRHTINISNQMYEQTVIILLKREKCKIWNRGIGSAAFVICQKLWIDPGRGVGGSFDENLFDPPFWQPGPLICLLAVRALEACLVPPPHPHHALY